MWYKKSDLLTDTYFGDVVTEQSTEEAKSYTKMT
jgi:hypothetical protein